jgi:hypothetical protein
VRQVTTEHVHCWGSDTKAPEMTDRGAPESIVEHRVEVVEHEEMVAGEAKPSGLKYAGGPAREPNA